MFRKMSQVFHDGAPFTDIFHNCRIQGLPADSHFAEFE